MYCIEVIKSNSFQSQKVSKGNFDRDSSFHFSRAGVVLHSGEHRSTVFIEADTEFHSEFRYWTKQEQAAVNGFIVACVEGLGDNQCHENACRVSRPLWKFSARKRRGHEFISATRKDGGLTIHHSANNWREIHFLTK